MSVNKVLTAILFSVVLAILPIRPVFALSTDKSPPSGQMFVEVARKVNPSVVNIFTTSTVKMPWNLGENGPDDLWRKFFDEFFGGDPFGAEPDGGRMPRPKRPSPKSAPKAMSLGSGFIIERTNGGGLIVTNNHVVEGAEEIKIKFTEAYEEKESDAEVIGRDPDLDVALLKVTTKRKLDPVELGSSEKLEVGEWVAAIGNPFGHGHSISHGIVSANERSLPGSFQNYLQVDAPINPGNSGGPLVNLAGEVVGINNAIDARGPGIGFAIPIHLVKAVLPQLKEKGRVERGYIGISVDELRPELAKQLKLDDSKKGPIVTNVIPGQPADKAGLQVYDVILEVNGKRVRNPLELIAIITGIPVGQTAKIKLLRSNKEKLFEVPVTKRPDFKAEKARPKGEKGKKGPKARRIYTGMDLEPVDAETAQQLKLPKGFKGVIVAQVAPDGPAFQSGIRRSDVILEVDQKPIKSEDDFYKVVKAKKTYLVRVRRLDDSGQEGFALISLDLGKTDDEDVEE